MSERFKKSDYDNEYARNNYDRIPLQVNKGQKDLILQHAISQGYKSINAYIKSLIENDMKKKED